MIEKSWPNLVWGKDQGQGSPGVFDLFQRVLNAKLLLSTINNLAACIYVLVQSQRHQPTQAERLVHLEMDPRGLPKIPSLVLICA